MHAHQTELGSRFRISIGFRDLLCGADGDMQASDRAYLDDCLAWGQEVSWHVKDKSDRPFDSGAYSLIYSQSGMGVIRRNRMPPSFSPPWRSWKNRTLRIRCPIDWLVSGKHGAPVCGRSVYGPPALAMLYQMTGDDKYVDWMDDFFWDVHGEIFDEDAGLFYRGPPSISRKTKNGKNAVVARQWLGLWRGDASGVICLKTMRVMSVTRPCMFKWRNHWRRVNSRWVLANQSG